MDQQFMGLNSRALMISSGIAGVLMGILSNIPIIFCVNCLLLGWVWGGAIFAVFLYRRNTRQAYLTNQQGLVLGAAAGVVGAIVGGIAALVFGGLTSLLMNQFFSSSQNLGNSIFNSLVSTGFSVLNIIRDIFVYGIVGALGGLIATALIWKTPATPLPPYTPPPPGPTA